MYDAIVVGVGGVGSAALFHLAARGARVLGLDRFLPGHDRGSSHGRTRIIRQAYFEHPNYVPLLFRAYQLWDELGERRGRALRHEIGLLQVGPPESSVLAGVRESAQRHQLKVEELNAREIGERFPGFRARDDWSGLFEPRAGYLDVEACVVAHIEDAVKLGAELQTGVEVRGWTKNPARIEVETSAGHFETGRLVVTAGPWAPQLLRDLGIWLLERQSCFDTLGAMPTARRGHELRPGMATQGSGHGTRHVSVEALLEVRRKPQFWYPAPDVYRADRGCPAYLFDLPEGIFYGLPAIDEFGLKAAEHTGGAIVADPLNVNRDLDRDERERVERFLTAYLPGVGRPCGHHSVCMYTMTADEHFFVDRHPTDERLVFAAGLSGHGFKFTCVLGEALADLALAGRTELPIGFLSLKRFLQT